MYFLITIKALTHKQVWVTSPFYNVLALRTPDVLAHCGFSLWEGKSNQGRGCLDQFSKTVSQDPPVGHNLIVGGSWNWHCKANDRQSKSYRKSNWATPEDLLYMWAGKCSLYLIKGEHKATRTFLIVELSKHSRKSSPPQYKGIVAGKVKLFF